MNNAIDLAHRFRELKEQEDDLKEQLKGVTATIKEIAVTLLPQAMEAQELEKFTVDDVGTIYISQEVYVHVKAEDQAKLFEWLEEQGNSDIIRPHVPPQTLKAFAKERLIEGKPLPDFMAAAFIPTARLRRA